MRSEVDENLFGAPNRVTQAQALRDNKSSTHSFSATIAYYRLTNFII